MADQGLITRDRGLLVEVGVEVGGRGSTVFVARAEAERGLE